MKTFFDSLDLIEHLKANQITLPQIKNSTDLEIFIEANPKLKIYIQDLEYLIEGSPKFVIDEKDGAKKYQALFYSNKFKNGQVSGTFSEFITINTSIPHENEYLGAFDKMVWNSFWSKYPNWNETMKASLKKGESFCSLSMKLLRPLKPNQKSYTFKKFKEICQDESFSHSGKAYYGTSKFYSSSDYLNVVDFLKSDYSTNKSIYTHVILQE